LTEEQKLIEKLQRIEALFAGATTNGEKVAAANALERIRERLWYKSRGAKGVKNCLKKM